MTSTEVPTVAGQFDDAEDVQQIQSVDRGQHAYIDTHDFEEVGLDLDDLDLEDDEEDEEYDDNRVEDEDWENAERGVYPLMESLDPIANVHCQTSPNSIIVFDNMSLSALGTHKERLLL